MGNNQRVCQLGGTFFPEGDLPHCVTGCPLSRLNTSNLTLIDGALLAMDRDVSIGQIVTLTCVSGATFVSGYSSRLVTCISDGMWYGVLTDKCVIQVTDSCVSSLFVCLFICLFVYLFVCLFYFCLFIFVYLFICLFVYLFVCFRLCLQYLD